MWTLWLASFRCFIFVYLCVYVFVCVVCVCHLMYASTSCFNKALGLKNSRQAVSMQLRIFSICRYSDVYSSPTFFNCHVIPKNLWKNILDNMKCVLLFCTTVVWNTFAAVNIYWHACRNAYRSSCKVSIILAEFIPMQNGSSIKLHELC